MTLAVLPFIGFGGEESQWSFGDHLCLQLSCSLMRLEKIAVIAYQAIRSAVSANPDYRALSSSFGLTHILTGWTQRNNDIIRVNMQIVECQTCRQIWSETIEYGISQTDDFQVQDRTCDCAARGIGEIERQHAAMSKTVPMLSAI
jgi:TolB-like protein